MNISERLWSPAAIKVILSIKADTGLAQHEKQNKRELGTSRWLTETNDLEDYQNFLDRALNKCKKFLYNRPTHNSGNK